MGNTTETEATKKIDGTLNINPKGSPPTNGSIQMHCVKAASEAETLQKTAILTLLRKIEANAPNAKVRNVKVRVVNLPVTKNTGDKIERNLGYVSKSKN
jgi:hypothetical protein